MDETQEGEECRGKLNLPLQSRLYKVLAVHKQGFSAKLLDILDGSKKEVLTSRLSNLSLEALQEYNFSSPTFYQNLQKMTDKFRNKFEAPTDRFHGLRLLRHDGLGAEGDREVTQQHQGVATGSHWKVPPHVDPAAEHGHDNADSITDVHPDHDGIQRGHVPTGVVQDGEHFTGEDVPTGIVQDGEHFTGKDGKHFTGLDGLELRDIQATQDVSPEEPGKITRYNTRYRGQKRVPVFVSQLKNTLIRPGIIKLSSYKISDNFKVESMRTINKGTFTARKSALSNHNEVCQEQTCPTCLYFKATEKFRHDSGNFSRYIQPSLTQQQPCERKKTKKTVRFSGTLFCSSSQFASLPLDIALLHKACIHNVSLREVRLLSRDY